MPNYTYIYIKAHVMLPDKSMKMLMMNEWKWISLWINVKLVRESRWMVMLTRGLDSECCGEERTSTEMPRAGLVPEPLLPANWPQGSRYECGKKRKEERRKERRQKPLFWKKLRKNHTGTVGRKVRRHNTVWVIWSHSHQSGYSAKCIHQDEDIQSIQIVLTSK